MLRPSAPTLAAALLAALLLPWAAEAARPPRWGSGCEDYKAGSVRLDSSDGRRARFTHAPEGGAAWGSYLDSRATRSNFGQLRITTSGEYSDADQVYAAGYLEGYLTAQRIYDSWVNMRDYFRSGMGAEVERPMKWIEAQDAWVRARCASAAAVAQQAVGQQAAGGGEGGATEQEQREQKGRGKGEKDARFWQAVCLALRQFDGLKDGYWARQAEAEAEAAAGGVDGAAGAIGAMSAWDFLFLESNGDLYDIIDAQQPDQRPSWVQGAPEVPRIPTVHPRTGGRHWAALDAAAAADPAAAAAKLFSKVALSGKCSALIKVAPDLSDLFMGHATWDTFTGVRAGPVGPMLRIYKHYRFNLTQLCPAAAAISFSSYPGELFSDDDFYITSPAGLVVLQTTNKIFNDELFEALDPHSVLSWQRVRAANWLAASGEEWAGHLDTHNSGTYNNQYMLVDLKRFSPGQALQPGLLWVAEQVPGRVVAADVTATLAMGYWPSHNVPFFPEIYNASGYPDFISRVDKYGQHFGRTTHWLSYQASPRAKIFRRDQAAVHDLDSMKAIMRGNSWRSDPFSEGHPICSVCGRGDLDPENPVPRGCYDTKVTSYRMALQLQAEAVNGPTTDRLPWSVPPFRWSEQCMANLTHRGQPEHFTYTFEVQDPAGRAPACARPWWRGGLLDEARAEAATLASGLLTS